MTFERGRNSAATELEPPVLGMGQVNDLGMMNDILRLLLAWWRWI